MNPSRCVAAACVALLLSVVSAGPASASADRTAEAPSKVAAAGTCGTTQFCTWSLKDFYGTKYAIPDHGNGVCMTGNNYQARSYINNTGIQGYFYANAGCSGRSRGISKGRNADIGFTARSFLFACVTC